MEMSDFWCCIVVCLFISLGSCLFEISSSALLANENYYFYTLILILSLTPHFFLYRIHNKSVKCNQSHILLLCGIIAIFSIFCSEIVIAFFPKNGLFHLEPLFRISYISASLVFLFKMWSKGNSGSDP